MTYHHSATTHSHFYVPSEIVEDRLVTKLRYMDVAWSHSNELESHMFRDYAILNNRRYPLMYQNANDRPFAKESKDDTRAVYILSAMYMYDQCRKYLRTAKGDIIDKIQNSNTWIYRV